MQNEHEANAIAWGLDEFQKSSLRVMTDAMSENLEPFIGDELIVTRGARFNVGMEFLPSSKWGKSLEEFTSSWGAHGEFLQFQLQLREGDRAVHRETSLAQKYSMESSAENKLDGVIIRNTHDGVFVGTHTALQLPAEYTNCSLTLTLVLSVVVPPSKTPSNYRLGMSPEEQEVRALLESGRYRPPRVTPRELHLSVRLIEALEVKCWAQAVEPTASLVSLELRNRHPYKSLVVHHFEVNLESSVRIEELPVKSLPTADPSQTQSKVILSACHPPLDVWFNLIEVCDPTEEHSPVSAITIARGEAHCIVFNLSPKSVVNEVLSAWGGGEQHLPLSSCGLPPPDFSGDFITPVEVRWTEARGAGGPAPPPVGDGAAAADVNCIVTNASLYWGVDKRVGKEFTIDFDGPASGLCLQPLSLCLTVTNFTSDRRSVRVFLQQPDCDEDLFHVVSASSPGEMQASKQQIQWMSEGVVNYDIEVSLK